MISFCHTCRHPMGAFGRPRPATLRVGHQEKDVGSGACRRQSAAKGGSARRRVKPREPSTNRRTRLRAGSKLAHRSTITNQRRLADSADWRLQPPERTIYWTPTRRVARPDSDGLVASRPDRVSTLNIESQVQSRLTIPRLATTFSS